MTTATTEMPPVEAALQRPYRMTYETYAKIAELEVIRREDHVVLLDGILVQTMTKGPEHINAVDRGEEVLKAALPPGWMVRDEDPIALRDGPGGDSAPEPDLAVLIGTRERYENRHPEAFDVGSIVEVASSPAAFRVERNGLYRYAHAMIPTVWIVALHDRTIHIFTEPTGPGSDPKYGRVEVKRSGELLEVVLPSSTPDQPPTILGPIAVASFFPPTL